MRLRSNNLLSSHGSTSEEPKLAYLVRLAHNPQGDEVIYRLLVSVKNK